MDEDNPGVGAVGRRIAAAVALALVAGLLAVVLLAGGSGYQVAAHLDNASQLVKGDLVEVAGQAVGTVDEIRLTDDGQAELRLSIDDAYAPLRRGTLAVVRLRSLSGVANRFVDLRQGPMDGEEIPDGGVLPAQDIESAVDLDELFDTFDPDTRAAAREVLEGFADSAEGRTAQANAAIRYLNPVLSASQRLFAELGRNDDLLERFIVESSRLVTDVADEREHLAGLVDHFATVSTALASRDAQLADAVARLPGFLRKANTTFVNLRATLDNFEISAAFRSSNNLKPGSPVRIAGVEVGKVTAVQPTAPGADSAKVTLRIADRGRPIHADARATIRPRIFLEGNFFVDLEPGTSAAPVLDDGDAIPATQTSTPVQFDQVLSALRRPTRTDVRMTLGELAAAYDAGLAGSFNRSLEDQAPAFRFSAIVAEALLGRRPHDLSDVVRDAGAVSEALDRSPPRLKSLIVDFDTFALSLARERDALADAVGELPRTLAAAAPALDALNAAFPPVRRLAADALPAVRSSGPAIAALRPLVAQLRGLVGRRELRGLTADLGRATPGLARLARTSVPLLGELRPFAACINSVILPWSRDTVPDPNFPARGRVYQTAVKWLPAVAGESRSFDANGQWFKVLGTGGIETFQLGEGLFGQGLFPILGVNPPRPAERPPLRPDVACETQQPPDLRTQAGPPPRRVHVDRDSPAASRRYERARATSIAVLRDQLRRAGSRAEVLDADATRATVEALARRAGNLAQLRRLTGGRSR